MKKILLAIILALVSIPAYAQQWDQVNGSMQVKSGPSAPLVIIDQTASGQKILSLRANGTEVCSATSTVFTCTGGFTIGGVILAPDGTAAAPSYSFASQPGLGFYRPGTNDLRLVIQANVDNFAWEGAAYQIASGGSLAWSSTTSAAGSPDVSLSRGAANRLDLATGDSFYIVSGGLGVGVTPPSAGQVQASSGLVVSAGGYWGDATRSIMRSPADGKVKVSTQDETSGILSDQFTNNPTCATNCGTSPTLDGVDSSFTLTMGATGSPASGFVVTFNGTWAASPQCTGAMALTGMAVGKLPLTLVTTTTTLTVVTNAVAPANNDKYHFICRLGQ